MNRIKVCVILYRRSLDLIKSCWVEFNFIKFKNLWKCKKCTEKLFPKAFSWIINFFFNWWGIFSTPCLLINLDSSNFIQNKCVLSTTYHNIQILLTSSKNCLWISRASFCIENWLTHFKLYLPSFWKLVLSLTQRQSVVKI